MEEERQMMEVYARGYRALRAHGLLDSTMSIVLFGMMAFKGDYDTILGALADMRGVAWQRLHAQLCYRLLLAGWQIEPGRFLERLAQGGTWKE